METIHANPAPGRLRHAVFDFDGTLSLVRAGWQRVMADQMVEALRAAPRAEAEAELRALVDEPILGMAGLPTLTQMQWLAEAVRARGGAPLAAEAYKAEYLARLHTRVHHLADLQAGDARPEQLRVPGALEFLQALHQHGVTSYIASGTDEPAVQAEAAALGLAPWLAEIHGARGNGHEPKRALMQRLARERHLAPGELAVFGDGRIEVEQARAAGGLAVGVASDETTEGGLNAPKRALLIAAGADVIVLDFKDSAPLLAYFWPTERRPDVNVRT